MEWPFHGALSGSGYLGAASVHPSHSTQILWGQHFLREYEKDQNTKIRRDQSFSMHSMHHFPSLLHLVCSSIDRASLTHATLCIVLHNTWLLGII
jgi:hypothetical protein